MGVGAHRATFVGSLGADGTDVGSLGGVAEESPPTAPLPWEALHTHLSQTLEPATVGSAWKVLFLV